MNQHKLLSIIIVIALVIPIVQSQISDQQIDDFKKEIEGQQLPSTAQKLLAPNERINLIIDSTNINIILKEYKIESVQKGVLEDNTLEISTSQSVIDKISAAQDQKKTALESLNRGEIQIKTKGFFKKIKFSIAKFILRFT